MKKILPLALSLALVQCLVAADPAPATNVAPAASPAPAIDPAQIELARAVIKSMHADRMLDQMSAQMQQMAAQSLNLTTGNLTPEQRATATKVSQKVMALSMDAAKGMIDKMDTIYAEVYSPAELKAMKAFFESPEGVSMLQKQPQIMRKLMPYIQEMQKDLIPKIQKITKEARSEEKSAAAAAAAAAAPTPAAAQPAKP